MVNVNKLKGKIVERGFSVADVAVRIKMHKSTLHRKLNDGDSFSIKEANLISKVLGLSSAEAMEIFFDHNVA
ncbi:helix-turn-helix domain-containing protein [Paenibacillus koleovorans]|uniref:helix-turn-helix domain-containing protein n=1 Tax=Paenibacillus koleovorans TaxID=121608 RepID=UPI000FDA89FE|nr:helix-turn-helix transcriptional regulator [Paenibacillus koleovorans]